MQPPKDDVEARLQRIRQLPLHQYLGVCRLESEDGNGVLTFAMNENVINPQGTLHGGVVYALCDVCAYAGLVSVLDADERAVTHDIHVSMMRVPGLDDDVQIRSKLIKKGRSLCFIDVTVTTPGKTLATARVTKSLMRTRR